jgi:hypothetical protein
MHLVDDLLLGNEVPQAQQVDIPSFCADKQALAPRLQAEGGDGLEPALQAGLAIKNTPKKSKKNPLKLCWVFLGFFKFIIFYENNTNCPFKLQYSASFSFFLSI